MGRLQEIQRLLGMAMRVPRVWAGLMLLASILSVVNLTRSAHGDVSANFRLTTLTAVFAALVWLPCAVRVVALVGGEIKTPAGEAATTGLAKLLEPLPAEEKRQALPPLLTALSSAQVIVASESRQDTDDLRRDLELQLAAVTPFEGGVREALHNFAMKYEDVRREDQPSSRRTRRMTSLMAQSRAVARATPPSFADLQNMLSNGSDGERVVALAVAQDRPDSRLAHLISEAIVNSRSAFEQYQALAAAHEVLPLLDRQQARELRRAIEQARVDDDRKPDADASRRILMDAILDALTPADRH